MMMGGLINLVLLAAAVQADDRALDSLPQDLPTIRYHLTARPWKPLGIPPTAYLDRIEGECRFWVNHQDASGAIIDPFNKREWQYSTPYLAYAVGTLISAERAKDLLGKGVLAMDHACANFASGKTDGHSEFFVPPLTGALALYAPHVPAEDPGLAYPDERDLPSRRDEQLADVFHERAMAAGPGRSSQRGIRDPRDRKRLVGQPAGPDRPEPLEPVP
jgi:hypothetical protein